MSEILTERELALICAVQESTDGKYNRYSHEYAVATIGKLLGCIAGLREKLEAAEARLGMATAYQVEPGLNITKHENGFWGFYETSEWIDAHFDDILADIYREYQTADAAFAALAAWQAGEKGEEG